MSESEVVLPVLGIDVAKDTFDVRIQINGKAKKKQFDNTSSGYVKLGGWLTHLGVSQVHACVEATGSYADDLAENLHQAG